MRTDGAISLDNAHPYHVLGGVHMMHNGILSKFRPAANSKKSDTATFVDEVVRPLLVEKGEAFVNTPEFAREMEKHTSMSNKLAFITPEKFIIIEPQFWAKTLSGLQVSNTYAYSVDNPTHYGRDYTVHRNVSFKAGDGKYGSTPPQPARRVYNDVGEYENDFCGMGYNPSRFHHGGANNGGAANTNTSPSGANLSVIVDNTEKKTASLLNSNGEPAITSRSKGVNAMTDAEFAEHEALINGEQDAAPASEDVQAEDYSWLAEQSIEDILEFVKSAPDMSARIIYNMYKDITEYAFQQEERLMSHGG
jgi:hypothetical protein